MTTRRQAMEVWAGGLAAVFTAWAAKPGQALPHPPSGVPVPGSKRGVASLMEQPLPEMKGKEVTMVTVEFAPGESGQPHRHPGPVFGYILEGSLLMQFEPRPPRTYTKGEAFYEPAMHVHKISRNLSNTRPSKLLAFQIKEKGQPETLPVK